MKAKEYLQQLEALNAKIEQKKIQAAELRELALCSGGFDYSKERVQTSMTDGRLENDVIRYVKLESEIQEDTYRLQTMKNVIVNQIHDLNDANCIKILFKRYVEFKSLEEISIDIGYSYIHVRRMHGFALLDFQKIIDKKIKDDTQ